jgi:hypothetical protein
MSDSNSDEWGMEELIIPSKTSETQDNPKNNDNNEDWGVAIQPQKIKPKQDLKPKEEGGPMIIIDITQLDENVHSKFDRNSVNHPEAASAWRKKIEANYDTYSKDGKLLENGTVIPCGSSVWRDALLRLRDERSGHYFSPIFPPQK